MTRIEQFLAEFERQVEAREDGLLERILCDYLRRLPFPELWTLITRSLAMSPENDEAPATQPVKRVAVATGATAMTPDEYETALLDCLASSRSWMKRSALRAQIGGTDEEFWQAVTRLKASGRVVRRGERSRTEYHVAEGGEPPREAAVGSAPPITSRPSTTPQRRPLNKAIASTSLQSWDLSAVETKRPSTPGVIRRRRATPPSDTAPAAVREAQGENHPA